MPSDQEAFDAPYAAAQLARQRSPLRRLVKARYVARVLRHIDGPAVDAGCGAGQILERLPPGSLGLEVNPHLIADLRARGLAVEQVAARADRVDLTAVAPGRFRCLVLSHVLEHFAGAEHILRRLLEDCAALGITTVIIVVPGQAGFRADPTHQTFVDLDFVQRHDLRAHAGFSLARHDWFPGNFAALGRLFAYHELHLVYRRSAGRDGQPPQSAAALAG